MLPAGYTRLEQAERRRGRMDKVNMRFSAQKILRHYNPQPRRLQPRKTRHAAFLVIAPLSMSSLLLLASPPPARANSRPATRLALSQHLTIQSGGIKQVSLPLAHRHSFSEAQNRKGSSR